MDCQSRFAYDLEPLFIESEKFWGFSINTMFFKPTPHYPQSCTYERVKSIFDLISCEAPSVFRILFLKFLLNISKILVFLIRINHNLLKLIIPNRFEFCLNR